MPKLPLVESALIRNPSPTKMNIPVYNISLNFHESHESLVGYWTKGRLYPLFVHAVPEWLKQLGVF